MIRRLAVLIVLVLAPSLAAAEELRGVALVIGESKYEELPALTNPAKDARDIDRMLGDLGFEVDRVLNADGDELREAIARFVDDARDADVALIYYSGHGIEVGGENFLAPTDTSLASAESAGASMVAVQPLLDELAKVVPVSIVLLDACRSDPFPPGQMVVLPGETEPVRVSSEGLAAVRGPTPLARPDVSPDSLGAVIGFAAEPGQSALDGPAGENSPYAAALIKHLAAGGFSFGDVMTMVTEEVYLKTKAKQLPWTNSSLRRVLSFATPEDDGNADETAIRSERRKLLLTISGTPEETRRYVEALAGQEQVPLDALYGMLEVLGIKASDGGNLEEQLKSGAERLKALLADRAGSAKSDPELERLSSLASEAEAEGAIALALKYRDEASARADQLLATRQDEAVRLKQDMIDIAQTYADNAAAAQINFEHLKAAGLYAKAAETVKDWDAERALDYNIRQGDALTDRGYYNVDNDALYAAIDAYNAALATVSRDTAPADWAKLQGRLGQVKQGLGARLGDAAVLRASIDAFEQALTVDTKEAAPREWAAAQNNLGNVLYSVGFRAKGQDLLRRSIAAFDAALTVYTPDREPVRWALAVSNRGGAMLALADAIYAATDTLQVEALKAGRTDAETLPEVVAAREQAVAILSDIIGSLDGALAARPRADSPLDWASIEHTRASALSDRGKLTSSADDFDAALSAYRDVLTVYDAARTPVQWTIAAANLAATLRQYAAMTKDTALLDEAADLLRRSIELTPQASSPLDWASQQLKLGNVLSDKLALDGLTGTADAAISAYRAAEQVTTADANPTDWERLQLYQVQVLLAIGTPTMDRRRLQEAYDLAVNSQAKLAALNAPQAGYFDQMVPMLAQILEALPK